jgi:uncharacterized protein YdaU (DUF1376 family)
MAKDPAFLFYPSDFLTGTMFMTNEQIGIYIRLLCSQHQHGGLINKIAFNSLVLDNEILRSKFVETDGGFYNNRLADEMEKRNKKSNNLSEAAKEVWKNRKNDKNTIVQKSDTIVLQSYNNTNTLVKKNDTIVIQPVNRNENENRNENKEKNEIEINPENELLWTNIKNSFFNDFRWLEKFCRDKKITQENLKLAMEDFCNDIELREDWKDLKELKSHFTNLFNKKNTYKNDKPTSSTTGKEIIFDRP